MMDFFAEGPAALGGILISAAICGWTFGRLQGGFAALEDGRVPAGQDASAAGALPAALHPSPSVDTARAQWGAALAAADSLGELHAEISAYRRTEKVFADPDGHALHLCPPGEAIRSACGGPAETGERSCGLAECACASCSSGTRPSLADLLPQGPVRAEPLYQPSLPDSGLTRV